MSTRDNIAIAESNGLPEGWWWSTLGDISEKPQYGWTTKANHDSGKLKLLRTTDITSGSVDWSFVPFCTEEPEDVEKYLVESGDVLISRAGSVGVSFLINKPERAVFASYLIRFRPKKEIVTKYFYYYLKSPAYWEAIGASKSGIAVPNVNASKLAQVSIPLAPLDQQKRIVAEIEKQFSRLDEAVANLKRVKANLKRYKAAVLKAAVEGRLVETESGPFVTQSLGRLGKWCGGGTPSKSKAEYWTDGDIPWVSPKDMKIEMISDAEDHITETAIKESTTNLILKGAVLIVTRSGILKHTLPVAVTIQAVAINQDLKALHPSEEYDPQYIALALRARQQDILHQCSKEGTTVQSVEFPLFLRYEIPIPPLSDQKRIVAEVERRLSLILEVGTQLDTNLKRAEGLRQSILGRAFSGQLFRHVAGMTETRPSLLTKIGNRHTTA